ncbi:GNAT family N-acetyltransferase [Actinoplanes couchii]|uniref:N-acetyltransferase domain-containing protein n=1 Tax=Actinoplanes couchii TaxID=403638 RepID=A0ABQ3XFZ5_9ACTN|nr:GNAT family N-acetyltransferase [Actinoplanes couchii]MDR6320906.1 ribosomal protein S18 acetylase RimI-like enzyme [Actinoplanes couchii]GID57419.1 hypothetical protein Aco03nite_058230 [Actinoplanes couchii]
MSGGEFEVWRGDIARRVAEAHVTAGNGSFAEGYAAGLARNAAALPQGAGTPGMLLLMGTAGDEPIGRLWVGLAHPRGVPNCAFLYDIEVFAAFRGRGLGRALLAAAETVAAGRGAEAIELNVFGANTTAIALYDSSGYRVTTQQMRKRLVTP